MATTETRKKKKVKETEKVPEKTKKPRFLELVKVRALINISFGKRPGYDRKRYQRGEIFYLTRELIKELGEGRAVEIVK
ncbi:hypothetical protein DRN97_03015 [Methanosarcinales archaeon]|nr:MAG: hypothetical protein DRN97_03015 [Methanosarcinales archaeon]